MKFFTADVHLGHKNIIRQDYCDRPFHTPEGEPDVDKMYRQFVENFNSVIKPGDELYILGDISFDPELAAKFMAQVNGQKFIVWGNHDPKKRKDRDLILGDMSVVKDGDLMETKLDTGVVVVMCHYPLLRWNKSHFGSIMLHGHTHGTLRYPSDKMRIIDVGVDSTFMIGKGEWHRKYFPVSEWELKQKMNDIPAMEHHYFPGE